MMSKFTMFLYLVLILVSAVLVLPGCFEEPTIPAVERPYSSVRVGNFGFNTDVINLTIDGVSYGSINKYEFTDRFDLLSGKRSFLVTNSAGDELFNGSVTAVSYEEMSIVFDGFSAPGVDTLNSFAAYPITDGLVYLDESPAAGETKVIVTNVAPDTDTSNVKRYTLNFINDAAGIDSITGLIVFNETQTFNLPAGDYFVWVLEDTTADPNAVIKQYDTLNSVTTTFGSTMREYFFIAGDPNVAEVIRLTEAPLPVRSK
ncbi:MAG: hypothetical protein Kow0098_11010 [Ignavibacteriaceae bacterium]